MKMIRWVLVCAVATCAPAYAQKACSKADAATAEKAIERVMSWPGLHKAYTDYRHCDSGPVSDVYTDTLLRMLVDWKNIDALAVLVAKDAEYKAWLHKRLLSDAAKDDRDSVFSRAKKDCPAKQDAFCSELADVVKGGTGARPKDAPPSDTIDLSPMKPFKTS